MVPAGKFRSIARQQGKEYISLNDLTPREQFEILDESAIRDQKRTEITYKGLSHGICQKHFNEVQEQNKKDLAEMLATRKGE